MDDSKQHSIEKLPHHTQLELCRTRPLYRQGKKLTAVKVAWRMCILFEFFQSFSYPLNFVREDMYKIYSKNNNKELIIFGI